MTISSCVFVLFLCVCVLYVDDEIYDRTSLSHIHSPYMCMLEGRERERERNRVREKDVSWKTLFIQVIFTESSNALTLLCVYVFVVCLYCTHIQ